MCSTDDDEVQVIFDIPLDGATVERLMALSAVCRQDPKKVAASLLHDILKDDQDAHLCGVDAVGEPRRQLH
jgi:hypothetical protein